MAQAPSLASLGLAEARAGLLKKEFSARELAEACLDRVSETEPLISACLHVFRDEALREASLLDAAGPKAERILWGLPVTVKDVYLARGAPTTAGSRMLKGYVSGYEAEVVTRLRRAGAVLCAKTNLDEYAMGSSTEFSAFRPTRNPWDLSRVPGGSSGGAAAGISARQAPGAFGTDTGGSIRQPAALCGCVGLKPSYGRVSRYGIVAYGSSLDQAGPLARSVSDCGLLLAAVAGPDGKDSTSSRIPPEDYASLSPPEPGRLRFALPRELWEARFDPETEKVLRAALRLLEGAGASLEAVPMPALRFSVAAYYVLAAAEASTNLARYDGVRYGYRAPEKSDLLGLYRGSRTAGLGREARRRILLGTFALSSGYYDAYFRKAAQVRRLIHDAFSGVYKGFDFILAPVSSVPAWPLGSFTDDPLTQYQLDMMTLPLNLHGGPGLSLPAGLGGDGLPVGIQILGPAFREKPLLEAGLLLEGLFPRLPEPPLKAL
ncbi:MAG: Asp-tRNA(Asn)/Glu-tRNA(Gln) amidotransferase subunit GatA [Deltaproteobacteria bacterium]|jgi:aspartyl-tRNA(Asn)/glutamyl-tRNA(Gln) amidotransferase subunit A|nr:Asp-tRNA(Asn)/Glu-tRNA(Gln) amidotransferase subunit GatA [Deltaproteobacteria bacterium]